MKLLSILFGFILLVGLSVGIFYTQNLKPVDSQAEKKNFSVNTGDTLSEIATRLDSNNIVKNRYVFIAHAKLLGLSNKLQAGNFLVSASMSTADIIRTLSTKGTRDIWIKIPEGSRNEELTLGTFNKDEFLIKSKTGDLFPDSYLVPDYYSLDEFLVQVEKNYQTKTAGIKLSPDDIILASLIEREGKTLEDKKVVAGILKNRLALGMPLQVDASAQYARDSRRPFPVKFWLPPSRDDLKIASLYNTYLNPGLPPSPICNPSLNSLVAIVNPTQSDYLFYIHDTSGKPYYAKTLDEHNQNIAKYLR